ncbi:hypothetical protein HMPREF2796_04905 [Eikenella sp. HMSC071B05]|nr:hypothetical protein HMPREF2796_04905 [Eikenella sp. HMSC071B05]OFO48664.1 hypothetical protein HMPREF3043_01160 [Eikenella sp. HMSC073A11]
MQKVIPTGKGQIAETKSAIKRGIEADSFAWLKDDCKDLVLLLTKRDLCKIPQNPLNSHQDI